MLWSRGMHLVGDPLQIRKVEAIEEYVNLVRRRFILDHRTEVMIRQF